MAVPLFFGEGRRRLFGVYDPAVSRTARGSRHARAIVFARHRDLSTTRHTVRCAV